METAILQYVSRQRMQATVLLMNQAKHRQVWAWYFINHLAQCAIAEPYCIILKKTVITIPCVSFIEIIQRNREHFTLLAKRQRADVEKLVGSMFVHAGIKTLVQPESHFFDPEAPEKNLNLFRGNPIAFR